MKYLAGLLLCILLTHYSQKLYAQNFEFSVNMKYGSYSMSNYHSYQEYMARILNEVNVKKLDQFPWYPMFELSIGGIILDKHFFGASIGFMATGGRMHYEDYSGKFLSDQLMSSTIVGGFYRTSIDPSKKIQLEIGLGVTISTMSFNETFRIHQNKEITSYSLKSDGIYSDVTLGYEFSLAHFSIVPQVGYFLNFNRSDFHLAEDKNAILELPGADNSSPDWSGWRIGVQIRVKV